MCPYTINANVGIIISDFQQKYVVVKAIRRSHGISKNLLVKKLKSKVYVSFRISLYIVMHNCVISNFENWFSDAESIRYIECFVHKRWKHHNCCYQKIRQVQCRSRTLSTTKQGSTLVKCWVFEARITMINFHDFCPKTMRLILCYRSFKMNQFYKNFPFGVIQKLSGPIFVLFWPPI